MTSFLALPAMGATFFVDPAERGWFNETPDDNGTAPTNNYIAGICCGNGEYRNFFEFAIPVLDGPVVAVNFLIDAANYISPDASETYQITSIPGVFGFTDLGTGTVWGSRVYTEADEGNTTTIAFNGAGIAAVVSGGTLQFGGRLTTIGQTTAEEAIFSSSSAGFLTRLEITTLSDVPEPATYSLVGAGLLALGLLRRKLTPQQK